MKSFGRRFFLLLATCACLTRLSAFGSDAPPLHEVLDGPAYSRFNLTLSDGWRTEIAGPFFFDNEEDSQSQWTLFPFYSHTRTSDVDWDEWEFFYPVFDYRRFGPESQLQLMEMITFSHSSDQAGDRTRHFTLFPFYFQARSSDPRLNYTAVVPFYGHLVNRFFRDDIRFVMFPLYSETRKKDMITDNYLYPFFDRARGQYYSGWQAWPLYGHKQKAAYLTTNVMSDVTTNGGFDRRFVIWPFYASERSGIGTTNPTDIKTLIPFYSRTRSPSRDSISYGWPFGYNIVNNREDGYTERDLFWPLYIKAHGSKTVTRYFPFYSDARNADLESKFIMWPVYKFNRLADKNVARQRMRILWFLYSDTIETALPSGHYKRRVDFWPFYTYHRQLNGSDRLQVMALLEPLFPNNRTIVREYSQGWSFWRAERNPQNGAASQSLLWNLYRHETSPGAKKTSLFFGLFQYQSTSNGVNWRVCGLRLGKDKSRARETKP